MFYSLAYTLGFAPWEKAATHPAAARHIASLLDREAEGRPSPYGRALDLGCGRGYWSVDLARRGWDVTGVDLVPKALDAAREKARDAGVAVRFVKGDVTALGEAGVEPGVPLFWDFGTLHGLSPEGLRAAGRGVDALAAEDASLLLMAWSPANRGPLPRGVTRQELEGAFEGWKVVAEEPFDATGLPAPIRRVGPRFFRLRRTPGRSGR
jgi:SAM-dependent methyltransferase